MVTVEELVVKATPTGIDDVNDQLEGMEKKVEESTAEVEDTGRSLDAMSGKFKGAMGAIVGGLAVAAGGILSRVPSIQGAVEQLGTTLDLLGLKIEEEFSDSLNTLNEDLAETNRKVSEADGPIDALMTAIDGIGQSIQNASVGALQRKIEDLIGVKVPENWLDFGWDVITMDFDGAVKNLKSIINDFLYMNFEEGTILDTIADNFEGTKRKARREFNNMKENLKRIMGNTISALKNDVFDFTDTFVEEVKGIWNRSKKHFNTLETKVGNKLDDIVDDALQAGKDLLDNFAEGLKNNEKVQAVTDAVDSLVSKIRSRLASSLAEKGPLSDLDEVGPGMVDTITDGVNNQTSATKPVSDKEMDRRASRVFSRMESRPVVSIDGREVERATQSYRDNGTDLRGRYG